MVDMAVEWQEQQRQQQWQRWQKDRWRVPERRKCERPVDENVSVFQVLEIKGLRYISLKFLTQVSLKRQEYHHPTPKSLRLGVWESHHWLKQNEGSYMRGLFRSCNISREYLATVLLTASVAHFCWKLRSTIPVNCPVTDNKRSEQQESDPSNQNH